MDGRGDFEVLLFDLGGVLIHFAGFDELTRLVPGAPDRNQVRSLWIASETVQRFERGAIGPDEFARSVIAELALDLTPSEFIARFVEWARGLYPGADAILRRLYRNHRLACLSNSNVLHTPLHRASVEPFMERCFFSDEIGHVKPDRAIFDHAIRVLDAPPRRIAFFDDTPVNVEAARGAGIEAYDVDGIEALDDLLRSLGVLDL